MKHSEDPLDHLPGAIAELERRGLFRQPADAISPDALSFCSNDYLGLAAAKAPPSPSGSGSSRLISGERDEHRRLERALAEWLHVEDVLVFTSGYCANVGTVSALAGPADVVVSDALNHASLIDGIRLSKARVVITPHRNLQAIDGALASRTEERAWVIVESYYSMDADGPDLAALRGICDARGAALIVDDAHAIGVLGPGGRGLCAEAGIAPDVLVGTLGKSLGSQGAFVAGRAVLRKWLWNRARSFVFSTGLAPCAAAAALRSLETLQRTPDIGARVQDLAVRLRRGLLAAGAAEGPSGGPPSVRAPQLLGFGHVVPVVIGTPEEAVHLANIAKANGIHVQAIRPPTVPEGTARLRLTVTARHTEQDIDRAIDVLRSALHQTGSLPE
ncbi:MAG: 8-amino-7-oxononanoate synthase [Polyangiaceae bacterium]|nr:8-amino-7-oxononanoate synthase [Polyangiaceae bacterium]